MIDVHQTHHPSSWGIRPVLFEVGSIGVPAYSFFIALGLLVGLSVFLYFAKQENEVNEKSFYIIFTALLGGVIGAKLPIWIVYLPEIIKTFPDPHYILSGRTIVGGLLGGTLAVWALKKKLKIKKKIGNAIAPGVALGIGIGRLGCFFRGCCYGIPTTLPWGVDFGDHILRHPTQLYETLFCFLLFIYLVFAIKHKPRPGILFKKFMLVYFSYRFVIEFIREEAKVFLQLSAFQYVSLLAIGYFTFKIFFSSNQLKNGKQNT